MQSIHLSNQDIAILRALYYRGPSRWVDTHHDAAHWSLCDRGLLTIERTDHSNRDEWALTNEGEGLIQDHLEALEYFRNREARR